MMKFAKNAFLFVSIALGLSACFGGASDTPTSEDFITVTGEFKPLGSVPDLEQVTHLFEDEDGEIYYAYSSRYNLDDKTYSDGEFEVYGLIQTFKNIDKPLFEVRKISLTEDAEAEDVTQVELTNTQLGVSFSHPSDWTMEEVQNGLRLKSPLLPELLEEDLIQLSKLDWTLTKSVSDPSEARVSEIETLVHQSYPALAAISGSSSFVGSDQLLAVKFEVSQMDVFYFVPRGSEVYELSLNLAGSEALQVQKNKNTFASVVTSFRFVPVEEDGETVSEPVEPPKTDPVSPISPSPTPTTPTPTPAPAPTGAQESFNKYASFESQTFQFSIDYPAAWYYLGASGTYHFSSEEFSEEGTPDGTLEMKLNTGKTAGVQKAGDSVEVTVLVNGRAYTLSGPAEYQTVLQAMADSIQPLESEEVN